MLYSQSNLGGVCGVASCTGMVSLGVALSKKKQEAFIRVVGLPCKGWDVT